MANIIIRRINVGDAANDIGFERTQEGTYISHISQYDSHKYNEAWQKKLKQAYAFFAIKEQQEQLGRTVTRERVGNRFRVTVRGIR